MSNLKQSMVRVASWEGRLLPGGVRLGPQVAHGGFGVVHRGRMEPAGPEVAVKVLLGARDDERVQSFRTEVALLSSLRHPNIASVVAAGVADEDGLTRPWMAIEWCEGWTLKEELRRRGGRRHSRAEAWELLGPIVHAVAYAHATGCVHRDLKPANVMLEPAGGQLRPRLIDWGIGKRVAPDVSTASGDTQTKSALQAYTPAYAAPEQVAGTRTGPWTDVHALGLLLTEVLVGQAPYGSDDRAIFAILDPTRPTPSTFGVDAGPWSAVLSRAMALHAAQRYRTAGELAAALLEADPALPRQGAAPAPTVVMALTQPAAAVPFGQPLRSEPRAGRRAAWVVLLGLAAAGAAAGTVFVVVGARPTHKRHAPSKDDGRMEGRPPDGAVTTTVATAATAASARSLAPSARPLDSVASLEALDDKALQDRVTGAGYTLYQSLPPYSDDHLSSTAATYYKNLQPVAVTRYRFKDQGYLDAYVSMVCKKEMLCLLGGKTLVSVWSEDPVARAAVRTAVGSGVAGAVHKP